MAIKIEGWYKEMEGRRDCARSLWMTENEIVNELGAGFLLFVSFCFQQAAFAKFLKENLACSIISNVSGCRDKLKTEGK